MYICIYNSIDFNMLMIIFNIYIYIHIYIYIPIYTNIYQYIPIYTYIHQYIPRYAKIYQDTNVPQYQFDTLRKVAQFLKPDPGQITTGGATAAPEAQVAGVLGV